MKLIVKFRLLTALFMLSLFSCQQAPVAQSSETAAATKAVTTVYVVRHAEKETVDPADRDPDLSADGRVRAEALKMLLKDKPVDALYTTRFKRTMNTLKPMADERGLTVQTYEPADVTSLKNQIMQNYAGKTVVIAGHSNTILPLVEAFGVQRPIAEVPDSKYDHIFKVSIAADNTATLDAGQYGKATN